MSKVYQLLDYLENTTIGEVIDTKVSVSHTVEFDITYNVLITEATDYTAIIGGRRKDNLRGIAFFPRYIASEGKWGFTATGGRLWFYYDNNYTASLNTIYRTHFANGKVQHYDEKGTPLLYGNVAEYLTEESLDNINMFLFGMNACSLDDASDYTITDPCIMRLYACKIWKDKVLVRDFVPMKRLSDNVCGLFDKVSKTFFTELKGNTDGFSGNVQDVYYDENGEKVSSLIGTSIITKLNYAIETKELIKQAITSKGISVADEETFRSYPDKIKKIGGANTGIDTSDGTATASDIIEGKIAYAQNKRIVGTLKVKSDSDDLKITDASYLFYGGARFDYFDELLKSCTSVTSAKEMFRNFYELTTLDLSSFDTSNVTTMDSMFYGCNELTTLNLSGFDTSNVTAFTNMFNGCAKLLELDLSSFDTSNVTDMRCMFYRCSVLTTLDLSSFDASKVTNISTMFQICSNLTNLSFMTNLGKGYTQKSANYSNYKLDLSQNTKLTHDSLMSVINNLYDLNLTYDVANGGTLYTQQLAIGSQNKARLTENEIAIATNKGWTVS